MFESFPMASVDREHLDLLLQASALLNSSLDLDEVLKSLLQEASRMLSNGEDVLVASDVIVETTTSLDASDGYGE